MKRITLWFVVIALLIMVLPVDAAGLTLHEKKCVAASGVTTMYLYKDAYSAKTVATLVNGNPIYAPEVHSGLRIWVLAKVGVGAWKEGYIDPLQCNLVDPYDPSISGMKLFQVNEGDAVEPVASPATEPLTTAYIVSVGANVALIAALILFVWWVSAKLSDGTSSSGVSVLMEMVINGAEKLARAQAVKTPNFDLDDKLADVLTELLAELRAKRSNSSTFTE